jgi:hypothetical protein
MNGTLGCFYIDGVIFHEPLFVINNAVGANDAVRARRVPSTLPSGTYRYSCIIVYELPMGRVIKYQFYTDYFEIIE